MIEWKQLREDARVRRAAELMGCAAGASLLTAASFNGFQIPLSTAFSAALSPVCGIAVLAGSLFTYALTGGLAKSPVFLCALALSAALRWLLGVQHTSRAAGWLAFASTMLSAVIFSMARLVGGRELIFWCISALLSGVLAYCIRRVLERFECGIPVRLHVGDAPAFSVCYVVAAAALCSVRVFMLNLGAIAVSLAVLTAARRYRASGGMILGTLSACALLLTDAKTAGFAAILPAAGLAAGYLAGKRSGFQFLVLQFFGGAGLFLSGWDRIVAQTWVNSMIGGLLFLFLPAVQIADLLIVWSDADAELAALNGARMDFLSHAIAGVRGSAERIANRLAKSDTSYDAVQRVCRKVCAECSYRETCWERGDRTAQESFQRLAESGLSEGVYAPFGCMKPLQVTDEFTRTKKERAAARALAARLRESQTLLFSQIRITEELLHRAGQQTQRTYHRELTRYVTDMLGKYHIALRAAAVTVTEHRRTVAELYLDADAKPDTSLILECLQEALQKPMECCGTEKAGDELRLIFQSMGGFSVQTAAAQCAVHDDEPCGDCWDTFSDREGTVYLAVSDGMGTGRTAAVDARIVLTNFRQLVQSGMDCKEAAAMINAIMLTKSGDERFATLDVAKICTDTAAVTLYKYGAGATFVRQGSRITVCQAATDPIGILPRTEPYTTVLKLDRGDMLFLLSDGLDDSVYPFIRQKLRQGGDLQELAHTFCAKAPRGSDGSPSDDVTVLAAAISGTALDDLC